MAQENNPFFVDPLGGANIAGGLAGIGQVIGQNQEKQKAEEQQKLMMAEVQQAHLSKDPDQIAKVMLKYPQFQKSIESAIGFKNEATKNNAVLTLQNVLANPENAESFFDSRIGFLKSQGQTDTSSTEQERAEYKRDPEGFLKRAELMLADLAPEASKVYQANKPKPTEYQQGSGVMAGYAFNPQTAEFTIDPKLKATIDADAEKKLQQTEGFFKPTDIKDINNKLTDLTKGSREIYNAAESLEGLRTNPSAAAKLAAVFKFMKALDPSSVVRETEQGQVYSASGAASQMAGMVNGLLGEGQLTNAGFDDLVATAKGMANSAVNSSNREVDDYLGVLSDKLPPETLKGMRNRVPKPFAKYKLGQVVEVNGKKYKVTGGDLNDPDLEVMQ